MTDLLRQLRGYGEQLEAHMGVLEVEDVRFVRVGTGPVRAIVDREAPHRRRWLVAAAAGAAAVVVIVLAVLLWSGGGSESAPFVDEGSTVPGTTLAVPTTAAPTTVAASTTTTTAPTTTTAVPGIVAVSIPAEDAPCCGSPVAVSAGEVWMVVDTELPAGVIGHLKDGTWTHWLLEAEGFVRPGFVDWQYPFVRGLAVAPDGTVWAATEVGVFAFDGGEWTRSFDDRMAAVAVDEGGTVWITDGLSLIRRDGESWEEVVSSSGQVGGGVDMAVLPGGEVWMTARGYGCMTGPLMRYDGVTLEAVEVTDRPFLGSYASAVEAAPNGDLWVGGFLGGDPAVSTEGVEPWTEPPVLARFDGAVWTVYDWPLPTPLGGGCTVPLLDMAIGPDSVVWLASLGGLASFDGTDWTVHIEHDSAQWQSSVDVAPDGTVWYTDEQGVYILDTP